MAKYPYLHSYAKYFLKKHNVRIRHNKKILFSYPPIPKNLPDYFYTKASPPQLITGNFKKSKSIREITSYKDLKEEGFVIKSYKIKSGERYNFMQRVKYEIRPIKYSDERTVKFIPKNHKILYDEINEGFKLKGKNSDNKWIYKKKKKEEQEKETALEKANRILGFKKYKKDDSIKIKIEEIPVGISYNKNKLVCIPKRKEPDHIGFVGRTGGGKTLGFHTMCDILFNFHNIKPILFDWKPESTTWNLPTEGADFVNRLNRINLKPKPLPVVFITPYTDSRTKKIVGGEEGIGIYMSLSFKNVIKNFNSFIEGHNEFILKGSKRYYTKKQKEFEKCKSYEELEKVIDSIGIESEKEFKRLSTVRATIKSLFDILIAKEITDINTNAPSKLCVEELLNDKIISKDYLSTLVTCMQSGLIPVFLPKYLQAVQFGKTSALSSYFNLLVKELHDIKKENKLFKNEWVYLFIDELGEMLIKGASSSIIEAFTQGRSAGVGVVYTCPQYTNLPREVKTATTYLFCMQYNNQKEINEICNIHDAKEYVKEDIKQLSKETPNECYIFPSKPLITYDLDNGKKEKWFEPIKIQLFPPMSRHKKPEE